MSSKKHLQVPLLLFKCSFVQIIIRWLWLRICQYFIPLKTEECYDLKNSTTLVYHQSLVFIAAINVNLNFPDLIDKNAVIFDMESKRLILCLRLVHNICGQIPVSLAQLDSTEY